MKLLANPLCLLLLITLNSAYAQQDEAAPASEDAISEKTDNAATSNSSQQKVPSAVTKQAVLPAKRPDKNQVFKPSEEISADIAVPFPVDI